MLSLNAVAQDDTQSGRDGRRMMMTGIEVQGLCHYIADANDQVQADAVLPVYITVALVLDKQTNGAQMSAAMVYRNDSAAHKWLALRDPEYTQRFRVLWRDTFQLHPLTQQDEANAANATSSNTYDGALFKIHKKFQIPVMFTDTGAVVANIADNSLHMIACGTNTRMQLAYNSRVHFVG